VRATALWYPTGLHDGKLGADADAGSLGRAGEIGGEVLLIFGTSDPHTPEEGRAVIKRGLEDAGVNFRWSLYDAEHAFGRDIGPRYDPAATDAAFAETVTVLGS
jgi:carboxymethylenebutenolidase